MSGNQASSIVSIGCSENESLTQFSPFEDEVRPGAVNSLAEIKTFVLIKPGYFGGNSHRGTR